MLIALGGGAILLVLFPVILRAQVPLSLYERSAEALEQGNFSQAESLLRPALAEHPNDARALGLMAVILDAEKRYEDAESFYDRALKLDPRSPALLNNIGNHYLEKGDFGRAKEAYLKVVTVDPAHPNANLHLAQMSVATKDGQAALEYLARLPEGTRSELPVELLRAQALGLAGRRAAAETLIQSIEKQAAGDPHIWFSAGMILAGFERYKEAEEAFSRALDASPSNFDILYNLGLAAARAGDLERALRIFETALNQRPEDVDCLYNLARIYSEGHQDDQAVALLVKAQQLAPRRPDIAMSLAQVSDKLGYYADAATAYNQYLRLRPGDDIARRERGFALARSAQIESGLVDLRWYAQKHPKDARGLYELGIAETARERSRALEHLNQAVALDPRFGAARYARAVLLYQAGQPAAALSDLEEAQKLDSNDASVLDELGQIDMALGRTSDALQVLGRAAKLTPNDPRTLAYYSRALLKAGRKQEGETVLAAFQQVQRDPGRRRPYGGLFDFLKLPPAEQEARYMAGLERQVSMNPNDAELKARLGSALLARGKAEDGLAAFRDVGSLTSDPKILDDCARVLMDYQQFGPARQFLERVVASDPARGDARLDLAIATFHSAGSHAGLAELEKTPPADRRGDYFLLRSQMLDAMGRLQEAAEDLTRGLRAAPTRSDLYLQAALFLIKHTQYQEAIDLLRQANRAVPDRPELLLTEATVYELLQQPESARKILTNIESRWPEWSKPYLVDGIMLETRLRSAQAKPLLETAIALGERDSIAYYYLALATTHAAPDDVEDAQKAIDEALKLNPADPYARALAGKIAYERKDYHASIAQLTAAIRLWPDMIEARQTLSAAYRALGDREKAADELKEVLRIKQATDGAEQAPPSPVRELLFTVRAPTEASAGVSP